MSPAYYTLHPVAAFLFPDCGIGSDPNGSGPCTGTYGPEYLGESVTSILSSGKGEVIAVGAALLAMFAVVVLLNMIRRPLKRAKPEPETEAAVACKQCGGLVSSEVDSVLCDDCFSQAINALEAGQVLCGCCGETYWGRFGEPEDFDYGEEPDPCPFCGGAGVDEAEPPADAGVCSVCGCASEELVGDLFPACPECAAASEAEARRSEVDDGPDDEATFEGNPNGIGGGGVRA
jgi:hypothetical protein